jgi:hypothetical protein
MAVLHRVVLRAPREDLHDPADLLVAADDRVKGTLPGQLVEVPRVSLECLVFLLGVLVGYPLASPDVHQDPVEAVPGDAAISQNFPCRAVLVLRHGNEDVLGADELVLELFCLLEGVLEDLVEPRGHVGLRCAPGYFRQAVEGLFNLPLDQPGVGPELLQGGRNDSLGLADQGRKQMLHIHGLVAELSGQGLGVLEGLLDFHGEFIEPHRSSLQKRFNISKLNRKRRLARPFPETSPPSARTLT